MTTGAIRHAELQSNSHQQTNTQRFTGRMPFLSPNQQCQGTEGKKVIYLKCTFERAVWFTVTVAFIYYVAILCWFDSRHAVLCLKTVVYIVAFCRVVTFANREGCVFITANVLIWTR